MNDLKRFVTLKVWQPLCSSEHREGQQGNRKNRDAEHIKNRGRLHYWETWTELARGEKPWRPKRFNLM
jgi:hypothetical protein